ncbi:MAG TPA: hypothetical protein VEU32_01985 [Burkholderiales bacterium]|nr:hypothetical protein [Burkholderiales bacterium]
MAPDSITAAGHDSESDSFLRRILGGMSVFSMLMTIPQVWTLWVDHQAAGVSLASWSAYLLSALLWFVYGLRQRDRNIYLPCIGWIALDLGVILGVMLSR